MQANNNCGRVCIAERVSAGFVGKRVQCVVNGEALEGLIISQSESAERPGHMIYQVKCINDTEMNIYLDELTFVCNEPDM